MLSWLALDFVLGGSYIGSFCAAFGRWFARFPAEARAVDCETSVSHKGWLKQFKLKLFSI